MTTKMNQTSIWPLPLRWTSVTSPILPFCLYLKFKVRVTTTSYLKFYLSNFFSDLGGSLGLWLGIGILQVLHLLVKTMLMAQSIWFSSKILLVWKTTYYFQVFELICKFLLPTLSQLFDKNSGPRKWANCSAFSHIFSYICNSSWSCRLMTNHERSKTVEPTNFNYKSLLDNWRKWHKNHPMYWESFKTFC